MYVNYVFNTYYILFGYFIGYLICKLFEPKAFLIIFFKNKKYSVRLHHFYFLLISFLAAIINLQNVMFTTLGLGLHDIVTEFKKSLNNIFISKKR